MDAYIEEGALYCEDCKGPGAFGPFAKGGGEADCPQHCDSCTVFLENPLTDDGNRYVIERVNDWLAHYNSLSETLELWADYYDYLWD